MDISGWFGGKIRQAREKKHLTAQQVADCADVSVRSLSDYEAGKRVPGLDTALKIAQMLQVELQGEDSPMPLEPLPDEGEAGGADADRKGHFVGNFHISMAGKPFIRWHIFQTRAGDADMDIPVDAGFEKHGPNDKTGSP